MKRKNTAFTLVELIVVITILAILWTIAFISLQWYNKDARDSTRLSSINNLKTSLELFSIQTWKYPLPDNSENVTYSWSVVWHQWTVGGNVITNLSKNLSKIPLDPLYGTEYVYSTLESRKEYELMSLYEWSIISHTDIINNTYAADQLSVRIDGTYNWIFVKTTNYIIPTPSIISSQEVVWWLVFDSEVIKSQVINWWINLPNMWTSKIQAFTWNLPNLVLSVYTGSINSTSTTGEKLALVEAIQSAYTGSSLASKLLYKDLLLKTSDEDKIAFVDSQILNIASIVCDASTKPIDNWHILYTINASSINQVYTKWGWECWFTCLDSYTGSNCESRPFPTTCSNTESITYSEAQGNQAFIYSNISDYVWCEIPDYPDAVSKIAWTTESSTVIVAKDSDLPWTVWWCDGVAISWAGSNGGGLQNTIDILAWCATASAARSCTEIWSDWYLPSKNELENVYLKRTDIGWLNESSYWASTESSSTQSIRVVFTNGTIWSSNKTNTLGVRCVSRF